MITSEEMNPGLAETKAETQAGLTESAAAADVQQVDAARFIGENGAAVLGGHADVGEPR